LGPLWGRGQVASPYELFSILWSNFSGFPGTALKNRKAGGGHFSKKFCANPRKVSTLRLGINIQRTVVRTPFEVFGKFKSVFSLIDFQKKKYSFEIPNDNFFP
jgi:hypothetical protein